MEHLLLRLNQEEDVPAYFAYPSSQQPVPLVLFNHSHGGDFTIGKEELRQSPPYMQKESLFAAFMKLGVAVGVIDMWGFGERKMVKMIATSDFSCKAKRYGAANL